MTEEAKVRRVNMPPQLAAANVLRKLSDARLLELFSDAVTFREKQLDQAYNIRQQIQMAIALAKQTPKAAQVEQVEQSD
jgi:hypothetical protein